MRRSLSLLCLFFVMVSSADTLALPWGKGQKSASTSSAFTTFAACMRDVARTLPGGAASLALEAGLEVICRGREAVARGHAAPCRLIRNYRDRERCQLFYGIARGRLHDCPQRGYPKIYDGLCSALVRGDPSLCRLAEDAQQPTCIGALLGRSACKQAKSRDKQRCLSAARAWKGKLKPGKRLLPKGYAPSFELRTTPLSKMTLRANMARIASKRLSRGVVLADRAGTGDYFAINSALAPRARRGNASEPLKIKLWVALPRAAAPKQVMLGQGSGGGTISFSLPSPYRWIKLPITAGKVSFKRVERKAGGRVVATFFLVASNGVDSVRVEGRLDTFVRQLLPLAQVERSMRFHTKPLRLRGLRSRGLLDAKQIAQVKKSVRKLDERRYHVDRALRDELVKDTMLISYGASIYRRSAAPRGYKLSQVYRNGVLWQLGLRDGDVVRSINGKPLENKEAAFVAYARLRRAKKLVLAVERKGRKLSLVYQIKRIRKKKDGKLRLANPDGPTTAGILGVLKGSKASVFGRMVGGGVSGYGGLGLRGTGRLNRATGKFAPGRGGGGKGYGKITLGGKATPPKKKKRKKKAKTIAPAPQN